MALETAVSQKLITEDGINGLPVRLVDQNGFVLSSEAKQVIATTGARTASGTSANFDLHGVRALIIICHITAVSGTTPTITFLFDISDDGGTTWYQAAGGSSQNTVSDAAILAGLGVVNPPASGFITTSAYSGPMGDTGRLRWGITGTTPSFTFRATLITQ